MLHLFQLPLRFSFAECPQDMRSYLSGNEGCNDSAAANHDRDKWDRRMRDSVSPQIGLDVPSAVGRCQKIAGRPTDPRNTAQQRAESKRHEDQEWEKQQYPRRCDRAVVRKD